MLNLSDLEFSNREFWAGFVASSFPTALDEETDTSVPEIIEEYEAADINWWSGFTKYYDGVLDETDGYIDNPESLFCKLTVSQTLKIEFHPGDTVYYVNDKQIANVGGEYKIQIFPFADLLKYSKNNADKRIFLLLLPLTVIESKNVDKAEKIVAEALEEIFDKTLSTRLAKSIVFGLSEE